MNKIEKDGKVAVLYSPGFGAGWSTWAYSADKAVLTMDARIVQPVLDGNIPEAVRVAKELVGDFYEGGAKDLEVEWLDKGVCFEINEYDGSESIHVIGNRDYLLA